MILKYVLILLLILHKPNGSHSKSELELDIVKHVLFGLSIELIGTLVIGLSASKRLLEYTLETNH